MWCVKFINYIYLGLRDLLIKFRIRKMETLGNAIISRLKQNTKSKCCVEGCLLYVYVSPSISRDYTYESWTLHDYDSEIQLKYSFFTLNPASTKLFFL